MDNVESNAVLTIVISTYNRCELMRNNLARMLSYELDSARWLVCDNDSLDNTWDMLQSFSDNRLRVMHNDINLDMNNTAVIPQHVATPFFLVLNDRDYIEEKELEDLCAFLTINKTYDMIASVKGGRLFKVGEHRGKEFYDYYFLANHPGTIVYRTEYFFNNLDFDLIKDKAIKGLSEEINNYVTFQTMLNLDKGFYRDNQYVIQPIDRENIKQTRRELFGHAYVLPEYHIPKIESQIEYAKNYPNKNNVRELLVSSYKNSLRKVELEFWYTVKDENFRKRNHCENADRKDWLKNGIQLTKAILHYEGIKEYRIRHKVVVAFAKSTFLHCLIMARCVIYKKEIQSNSI